jgi:hypothetical protein
MKMLHFSMRLLSFDLLHCSSRIAVMAILIAIAAPASAQIDSDPSNDTAAGGNTLFLPAGTGLSNVADLAGEGGDVDFFNVPLLTGQVLLGMTTPLDNLPFDYLYPDTIASVMLGGGQFTFSDDDFSGVLPAEDDNYGSMFRFRASTAATYNIGISGYGDFEFDSDTSGGIHEEFGLYALTAGRVNPAVLGGGFADNDPSNDTSSGADIISFGASNAAVNVAELLAGDDDFYELHLSAGDVLSAMTAPFDSLATSYTSPDTLLGLYDSNGVLLLENDDAGDAEGSDLNPELGSDHPNIDDAIWGSGIRALIPADGTYFLRVTQSLLQDPDSQFGRYGLLVGVVPDFAPPAVDVDFNEDGSVNAADYVVWRKLFGNPYDELDYDNWVANFGQPAGGGAAAPAVPEPATASLLFATAVVLTHWQRRRR